MDTLPVVKVLRVMLEKADCANLAGLVDSLLDDVVADESVWMHVGSVVMDHLNDTSWPLPSSWMGPKVWSGMFGLAHSELAKERTHVLDAHHAAFVCARAASEKAAELWCSKYVRTSAVFLDGGVEQAAKRAAYLHARTFLSRLASQGGSLPEEEQNSASEWVRILTAVSYQALMDAAESIGAKDSEQG